MSISFIVKRAFGSFNMIKSPLVWIDCEVKKKKID